MTDRCEDCTEVRKLGFQVDGLELILQRQKVDIDAVQQNQNNKDVEHEAMIQNLTDRMNTVSQDLQTFKAEVKQDIQGVKNDIPAMFDNAVNKLLAKMFKCALVGVLVLIAVIALAFTRPVIVKGLTELVQWVETYKVEK